MTIPGKVQSYMSAGKPIIGAINGNCVNFISNNRIGYSCDATDNKALACIICGLKFDTLKNLGSNSNEVYFRKYNKTFLSLELSLFLGSIVIYE